MEIPYLPWFLLVFTMVFTMVSLAFDMGRGTFFHGCTEAHGVPVAFAVAGERPFAQCGSETALGELSLEGSH